MGNDKKRKIYTRTSGKKGSGDYEKIEYVKVPIFEIKKYMNTLDKNLKLKKGRK